MTASITKSWGEQVRTVFASYPDRELLSMAVACLDELLNEGDFPNWTEAQADYACVLAALDRCVKFLDKGGDAKI